MPLSNYEQRVLAQIEAQLCDEDPKFAAALARSRRHSPCLARKVRAAAFFATGVVVMLGGLMLPSLMIGEFAALSIVGFLVMFGAALYGWSPVPTVHSAPKADSALP